MASNKRMAKNFNSIESVLIVWDASQSKSDIEELKTFGHELRQSGKEITFLTYHPIKKLSPDMLPNEIYHLCSKADFSFFEVPKGASLKALLNKPFDLFINGCLADNKTMKTLAAYTQSQFRIGPYIDSEDTNFYELMIIPNGADPCENYLIEIGKYLKKIH
ncbi:MAG: hypothetical protein PSX81_04590 [bacterium]|nr:hypothetical protein [bacterium]